MQQEFKQNGFVYLKNVFSQAEISQLEADLKEAAATKSGDDVLDKGNLKFHALLMHRSEKIRTFISQAKIIDLLIPLAGPDIWVRWVYVVEYMKSGDIDPNVDAPYLMIAKNGKPQLEYVDQLSNQFSLRNRLKYTNLKQTIRNFLPI